MSNLTRKQVEGLVNAEVYWGNDVTALGATCLATMDALTTARGIDLTHLEEGL
jgi:hypothetical protein